MGRNVVERLKDGGIEAKKGTQPLMAVAGLWFAPKGHPLFDPRSEYPTDEAMAVDMADRFGRGDPVLDHAVLVREEGVHDGMLREHVLDGHQRTNALRRAEKILHDRGLLSFGEPLFVKVEFFAGSDAEFIEERIRRNARFWDRPDLPSVLAVRVRQLLGLGRDAKAIAAVCAKGIGPAEVEALSRWGNLTKEAREAFDTARFPLSLLPVVLDAPREEQIARGEGALAQGLRTAKGVTRRANTEREKNGEPRPMRALRPAKCLDVAREALAVDVSTLQAGEADFVRGVAFFARFVGGAKRPGTCPAPVLEILKRARGGKLAKRKAARVKGGKRAGR